MSIQEQTKLAAGDLLGARPANGAAPDSSISLVDENKEAANERFYYATQWQLIRWRFGRHKVAMLALILLVVLYVLAIFAEFFSPYTEHFRHNPEYARHTYLVDLGIQSNYDRVWGADATLFGLAIFKNSYGQPSQYIYWGQQWDIKPWLYAKVTAGLLHGYKGKYKTNIPFNDLGVAPAIIPSVGLRYGNFRVEGVVLGFSALMFNVGYTF